MDSAWLYRAMIRGKKFCKVPAVSSSMSLGREDEREYLVILRECCDSFIKYGLADKAEAFWYYYFYALVKRMIRTVFLSEKNYVMSLCLNEGWSIFWSNVCLPKQSIRTIQWRLLAVSQDNCGSCFYTVTAGGIKILVWSILRKWIYCFLRTSDAPFPATSGIELVADVIIVTPTINASRIVRPLS